MVMEYGENDENSDGVTKWPFYFSAIFILALVLGFAYLHFQKHNSLDQWQLVTCILASALASVLVFIPHLLDRFLYLVFDPANRKDEELHRKTYFDIKEMRGDLETLAVKVDKVPSLVDKILAESLSGSDKPNPLLEKISTELEESKEELLEKIRIIQELTEQSPLLPEPDPAIAQANESISQLGNSLTDLSNRIEELQATVNQIPTEFPEATISPLQEPELLSADPDELIPTEEEDTQEEIEIQPAEEKDELIEEIPEETDSVTKEESVDTESDTEAQEQEDIAPKLEETKEDKEETQTVDEETEPKGEEPNAPIEEVPEETESESEPLAEEFAEEEEKDEEKEEPDSKPQEPEEGEETEAEQETGELNLDLPDPEETLRKVDALLAGEDASTGSEPAKEPIKPKSSPGGSTSVVANVMIGIGNKPYLRGEGAGLSWDEGVPMNFIEIGKWAWTPTRKNAALTVQVYRNDEEPDTGGKIEVKSGEEIEITPEFS